MQLFEPIRRNTRSVTIPYLGARCVSGVRAALSGGARPARGLAGREPAIVAIYGIERTLDLWLAARCAYCVHTRIELLDTRDATSLCAFFWARRSSHQQTPKRIFSLTGPLYCPHRWRFLRQLAERLHECLPISHLLDIPVAPLCFSWPPASGDLGWLRA